MIVGKRTVRAILWMSARLSNQVLAQILLPVKAEEFELGVYPLDKELGEEGARRYLDSLGVRLTELTDNQADYLGIPVSGPYKPQHSKY